jgi:hypothetical protein
VCNQKKAVRLSTSVEQEEKLVHGREALELGKEGEGFGEKLSGFF